MTEHPQDSQPQQPSAAQQHEGQPSAAQQHEGQPSENQPYEGQPYENRPPYGGQPYGGQPYEGQPYEGQPYEGQPYGGTMPPYDPQAPQPPGTQPRYQPVPMSPADQRNWAIAVHLSPFLAVLVGLTFMGPLIIYIVCKDRGPFIRQHSAAALNFQLTMWIGLLVSVPLMFILIGFLTAGAIGIAMLVFPILGAVAASEGREYYYPISIPFVS
ncbi:MAG TPA: DUF4870 domain-containing protein [Dermatophilaceae bacterium]